MNIIVDCSYETRDQARNDNRFYEYLRDIQERIMGEDLYSEHLAERAAEAAVTA